MMKRRDFLIAGGAMAASVGLGSTLAGVVAPSDRIGIGVIGTGVRGKLLMKHMRKVPMLRLEAYCDVLPFHLEDAGSKVDSSARAYSDHRKLLDNKAVQAVIVATHFSEHQRVVLDALDAGKHVYCEKTMTKGIAGTRQVFGAAQVRPGQIFQTGYQYRSSPLYNAAASMIANGDIGPITAINCQWNRNGNWRRPVPDPKWERQINWRMYREYSSGLVAELCSHQMDFCDRVIGSELQQIQGVGGIDYWKDGRETYDNVHVISRYASGVTATFSSQTTNSLGKYRIAVLGRKGSVILTTRNGWFVPESAATEVPAEFDAMSGATLVVGPEQGYSTVDEGSMKRINAPDDDPTQIALEKFAEAIRDNHQPASNVATGAKASVMVQMAIDAMDRQQVIPWSSEYDFAHKAG